MFGCPNSTSHDGTTSDYWLLGFGGGIYPAWGGPFKTGEGRERFYHTKMSKLATPVNGKPKFMFGDNIWQNKGSTAKTEEVFYQWNNHNQGDPQGMNYIIGDGSGKWAPKTDLRTMSSKVSSQMTPKNVNVTFGVYLYEPGGINKIQLYLAEADGTTTQVLNNSLTAPWSPFVSGWINEFY